MRWFTDGLADILHRLMAGIYSTLSPAAGWIDSVNFAGRGQLDRWGVPLGIQGWIIGALWAVLVCVLVWGLRGRLRVLAAVLVVAVLARYFQLLPGV